MKKIKTLLVAALALFTATTAMAQEETRNYPYGFIGLQGGGQAIMNGYNFGDVLTGTGSVYGGVMINPILGTRLHLNGWSSKEGVKIDGTEYGTYGFNYATATVDMLVNLVSAFNHRDDNAVDLYLIGGIGANKVWGNEYKELGIYPTQELASKVHNHVAHACRLGLAMDVNLAPAWALNLEVDANHFGNHDYAHLVNASKDWQLTAQLGVKYRFGQARPVKAAPVVPQPVQPEPAPVEEKKPEPKPTPAPAPVVEKKPEPAPVVVEQKKLETMRKEIFYLCAVSTAQEDNAKKIEEAAAWLKAHPTATATVDGYADKGTGNPEINVRYARERAQKVKDALVKAGVSASRLTVNSYGDKVQPFAENDKNRCVIIVGAEK